MEAKAEKTALKIRQGRSPSYPYLTLEKAIERAEQINAAGATRTEMPPETFYSIWGLGPKSSSSRLVMAALNQFGLVEYVGRGDDRKVTLTNLARNILLDKIPNSKEKAAAIRQAALTPEIHKELWEKYGSFLPNNIVIESFLGRDKDYNPQAAKHLTDEYRDTFEFAGLSQSEKITNDNISNPSNDSTPDRDLSEIAVGDFIQWESNGSLQFDKPRQVRAITEHEGIEWIFVKGSETGIPLSEAIFESKGPPTNGVSRVAIPPKMSESVEDEALVSGSIKAICPLDEGNAILIIPKNLSKESYEDLKYWFIGELRKAGRKAKVSCNEDSFSDPV